MFKKILTVVVCISLSMAMGVTALADEVTLNVNPTDVALEQEVIVLPTMAESLKLTASVTSLVDTVDTVIPKKCGDKEYLFLPAYADLSRLTLNFDKNIILVATYKKESAQIESGIPFDATAFLTKPYSDGSMAMMFTAYMAGTPIEFELRIMKSANIASMFVKSADPAKKGLAYTSENKDHKAKGEMSLIGENGVPVYLGGLSQIKTRGNSTWACVKKPFQIKLDSSTDLIETGISDNKSKTWILLADAYDPTLIRNSLAYEFANDLGVIAPDGRFVDLYYDGLYLGNYYLCEKVQSGKGRVPVDDSGYLLEMDIMYGNQEDQYFTDIANNTFVIKEPEDISDDRIKTIEAYMNATLVAASMGGVDPSTGLSVWDYVDMDSLARYYVFLENTANPDMFISSTYFYLPAGGKLMAGPAWDFDSAFGLSDEAGTNKTYGLTQNMQWIGIFLGIPEFKKAVRKYEAEASKIMSNMASSKVKNTANTISASQKMDSVCWKDFDFNIYHKTSSYSSDISYLRNYISGRNSWCISNLGR